jgi:hypothetical protein
MPPGDGVDGNGWGGVRVERLVSRCCCVMGAVLQARWWVCGSGSVAGE